MSLKGASDLRSRLRNLKLTFKGYGRTWADETGREAKRRVPNRNTKWSTGRLHDSIKRRNATQKRATVVAHYTANFVDAGSKAHDVTAKGRSLRGFVGSGGQTIFSKKVHKQRIAPRRFKAASAHAALRKHPIKETMIELWNDGA